MGERERQSRSVRLARMQHLLYVHPHGITSGELARLSGVCQRTVQRDLRTLEAEFGIPLTQDKRRYGILAGYKLAPVGFTLFEAAALFLVARLVLHQTDEFNPHMLEAITKIAAVLPPSISSRFPSSIQGLTDKPIREGYAEIFERVALAWSSNRKLRVHYYSYRSGDVKEWVLSPYLVETTGTGYSNYVIGNAEREGKSGIRTFKLSRIAEAELLQDTFADPEGIDLDQWLHSAWGVMWGDEVEVKLRFSAAVTRRVKESTWHSSQVIEDLPDGGCLVTVRVGSTMEITPWIRGWGPDVEVLEPEEFRASFGTWAETLHAMYGVGPEDTVRDQEQ